MFNPQDPNSVVCPFHDVPIAEGTPTIGKFSTVDSVEAKPLAYLLGTSWCPHCAWQKPIFKRVAEQFPLIESRIVVLDEQSTGEDIEIINHYSPEGSRPVVVIGGKHFRIGAGESHGEEHDELVLTALFCDIGEDDPAVCSDPEVVELIQQI